MFNNKNIVICVCGGIAIYKVLDLIVELRELGANVTVAMTDRAQEFVKPLSFMMISGNKVYTEEDKTSLNSEISHIILAQRPDFILIAPTTANMIGKIASGIADDLVSSIVIASKVPVVLAPAMNTAMYERDVTKDNLQLLKSRGYKIIIPDVGSMAMKEEGSGIGRFPKQERIIEELLEWKL